MAAMKTPMGTINNPHVIGIAGNFGQPNQTINTPMGIIKNAQVIGKTFDNQGSSRIVS